VGEAPVTLGYRSFARLVLFLLMKNAPRRDRKKKTRSHFAFKHVSPFSPISHFAPPPEPDPAHPTPNDAPARRRGRPAPWACSSATRSRPSTCPRRASAAAQPHSPVSPSSRSFRLRPPRAPISTPPRQPSQMICCCFHAPILLPRPHTGRLQQPIGI
jgi:hypothetical protein